MHVVNMCLHAQVSASFLSSKPVLKALQVMDSVPLAEELVHGQSKLVEYLPPEVAQEVGRC